MMWPYGKRSRYDLRVCVTHTRREYPADRAVRSCCCRCGFSCDISTLYKLVTTLLYSMYGTAQYVGSQKHFKNILRSNCVAGIKILTNAFGPEFKMHSAQLNSAPNAFFSDFRLPCFRNIYIINPYIFAGDPARAAANWGRVGPRDATASARATWNAGPGIGAAPSARLAPSRLAKGAFCGHQDHLGQVQSPWRSREAIKKYFVWTVLSRTVYACICDLK